MRCCALTIRDAAMSSIARVIFFVDCTERVRRRYSRRFAPNDLLRLPVGVGVRAVVRTAVGGGLRAVAVVLATAALRLERLLAFLTFTHGLGGVLLLPDRVAGRGLELLLEV